VQKRYRRASGQNERWDFPLPATAVAPHRGGRGRGVREGASSTAREPVCRHDWGRGSVGVGGNKRVALYEENKNIKCNTDILKISLKTLMSHLWRVKLQPQSNAKNDYFFIHPLPCANEYSTTDPRAEVEVVDGGARGVGVKTDAAGGVRDRGPLLNRWWRGISKFDYLEAMFYVDRLERLLGKGVIRACPTNGAKYC